MKKSKISIIVPVYNVERFVSKCIDSILRQTYQNWELLLINDGSLDSSGEICDKYAIMDPRIKVFHKANGGVSSARNLGLYYATGRFITFIDSDDWVDDGYLCDFLMFDNLIPEDIIIIQGIQQDLPEKKSVIMFQYPNKTLSFANNLSEVNECNVLLNGCPVAKIFSREIIMKNNIRFNTDISLNEDHLFFITYLSYVSTIHLVNSINYHYYYDFKIPSLTKISHSTAESILAAQLLSEAFVNLAKKNNIEIMEWGRCYSLFGPSQLFRASRSSLSEDDSFEQFKHVNEEFNRLVDYPQRLSQFDFYSRAYIFFNEKHNVYILYFVSFILNMLDELKGTIKYLIKKYILCFV